MHLRRSLEEGRRVDDRIGCPTFRLLLLLRLVDHFEDVQSDGCTENGLPLGKLRPNGGSIVDESCPENGFGHRQLVEIVMRRSEVYQGVSVDGTACKKKKKCC